MEIKFIYDTVQYIEENFLGQSRSVSVAAGKGCIFTTELVKGKMEVSGRSLCGKSRSDIGVKTTIKQSRIANLPVCEDCAEAWKKHPESEWVKFVGVQ